jgi:flavin reductase (DIM6/NTAB) family NADH-FMN oxidoreductase RutF
MPGGKGQIEPGPIAEALGAFASPRLILTCAFEEVRAGLRARSAQVCSDDPPLLGVVVRKGHPIDPIIRDSRSFALCVVDPDDKLLSRKFPEPGDPTPGSDDVPADNHDFDALACTTLRTGAPIFRRALAAFDCEVVRHFDLEADFEIYVGQVLAARLTPGTGPLR